MAYPEKIRTIFIGTPLFAVPSLNALIKDERFDIVAVVTQGDKKAGRKQVVTPPPVKIEAEKNNIPVFQPEKILNLESEILNLKPDIIIVIAYAQIIPEKILNIPEYGCINVHGSLLPKYRGASPIQAAILNGDDKTGITIMKMAKGLDSGPILAEKEVNIAPSDTTASLYERLSRISAEILPEVLKKYIEGKIKPVEQDGAKASYVGLIKKEDGRVNWNKPAEEIERLIRAMNVWPCAYAMIDDRRQKTDDRKEKQILKIIEVDHKPLKINKYKIGELFLDNNKLAVQCGKDALIIKKLQLEGKKEMASEEFLRGYKKFVGKIME
jgi:methionyl-tRNA formyltransferase